MQHQRFFLKHPVFTKQEFEEYINPSGTRSDRVAEASLAYHPRAGNLLRVRRGLYATVPPGIDADSFIPDPYLVASRLTPNAVISHHSAAALLGKAYSVRELINYSATRPVGQFAFRGVQFRGAAFSKALVRKGGEHFGVTTIDRQGMDVKVTGYERTMVDMLDRPELTGSWEEIWRSLQAIEFVDIALVIEYVQLLENKTTSAKVGFFLEQNREALFVEEEHLRALEELRPSQPHYLERSQRETGKLITRWNLIVPEFILNESWGAVL